jgi:flagellar motor switch protein FliN/FliY
MSAAGNHPPLRLEAVENARILLDRWTGSLAQVIESMTDQRPTVGWETASGTLSEVTAGRAFLWWEQPFQIDPQAAMWIGAAETTWEYAAALTLKAAGLETAGKAEAKNTWLEILSQSLAAAARSIGTLLHREVTTENGAERAPDESLTEWASVTLTFAAPDAPAGAASLLVALHPKLLALIDAPPAEPEPVTALAPGLESVRESDAPVQSRTMELLLDVDLPVSISFGKALMPMKDVLKLTTGSIVELNRGLNDPVEVLVNHCLIARGEVVVVEGNYGIRIQEIVSRQDRLRSLR